MRARGPTGAARLLDSCRGREQRSRTSSSGAGLLRTPPARAARRRNVQATTPREQPAPPLGGTRRRRRSSVPRLQTHHRGCCRRGTTRAECEPRGCKVPVRMHGGAGRAAHALARLRRIIRSLPTTHWIRSTSTELDRTCSQLCTRQPPDADQDNSKTHSTVPQQPTRSI